MKPESRLIAFIKARPWAIRAVLIAFLPLALLLCLRRLAAEALRAARSSWRWEWKDTWALLFSKIRNPKA